MVWFPPIPRLRRPRAVLLTPHVLVGVPAPVGSPPTRGVAPGIHEAWGSYVVGVSWPRPLPPIFVGLLVVGHVFARHVFAAVNVTRQADAASYCHLSLCLEYLLWAISMPCCTLR